MGGVFFGMKKFLDEDFLLQSATAVQLYHTVAAGLPIIDYHSHLPPHEIADNKQYQNLTQIWLDGDHYKWRAMRTQGISESFITGDADDYDKFLKWAETVPYTLRNPLYHWTHLELKNPFGITQLLNPSTASEIYDSCSEMLATDGFSCRGILEKMGVEVVCTTDDPIDDLAHHEQILQSGFRAKVLPTFRPDKALAVDDPVFFNSYIDRLEQASGVSIAGYDDLIQALASRHDFFHLNGCRLSDHGLETVFAEDFNHAQIDQIFSSVRAGREVPPRDQLVYKSGLLIDLAEMDHEKGWVQQYHLGALRNNNSRMMRQLGPDSGFDSMGDFEIGKPLSRFLDRLDTQNRLAKTILYNLNPRDNDLIATMIGNFNDGSFRGKMQFGTGWWFLDQKNGMEDQMNTLSNMGLLSSFVGMVTDSRSFLSYPRHEYFRRVLCNLIGNDVENGELPEDLDLLGSLVSNVCYHNAKAYFDF